MSAIVYSAEIRAQFAECRDCRRSPEVWASLGKCVEPFPDGKPIRLLHIVTGKRGNEVSRAVIGPEWTTCPMAYLRPDLYPEETAVAAFVADAHVAGVVGRTAVPGRLFDLVGHLEAEARRYQAEVRRASHTAPAQVSDG